MVPITKTNWSNQLFKIRMYTKLMENYNEVPQIVEHDGLKALSDDANASGYISSVCSCFNCMDTPIVIANRADGALIKFTLDEYGEAGFIPTRLNMQGDKAVVGLGSDDRCYLFAIEGKKVWYSMETRAGSGKFGDNIYFNTMHSHMDEFTPVKIITRKFDKRLCVCVVYSETSTSANSAIYLNLDFCENNTLLDLKSSTYPDDYENFDFAYIQNQVHLISYYEKKVTVWNFENSTGKSYTLDKNEVPMSMRWTKWKGENGRIVTLLKKSTGSAYGVIDLSGTTARLTECQTLTETCALEICELKDGPVAQIHVLLSGLGHIYHAFIEDSGTTTYGSFPMPIGNSNGKASFISGDKDYVEFYMPLPAAGGVVQTCKMSDGSYTKSECHIITGDTSEIIVTPCYSTELVFTDSEDAPLSGLSVNVWSTDNIYIECDNGTHRIGPKKNLLIKTNKLGKITLVQHTDSLSGATICYNVPSHMSPTEVIYLNQHSEVSEYLESLSASDLVSAKDSDGDWVLPQKYRNLTEAEKILSAVKTMLSAVTMRSKESGSTGAFWGTTDNVSFGVKHIDDGFILSNSPDGGLIKQSINIDGFRARIENCLANGYTNIVSSIGDVCHSIADNCATADSISACEDQVMFELTVSNKKCLYVGTLTDEYQALDSIGSIFAKSGVSFNGFFSWVGFIFDWNDFLRMKRGIDYVFDKVPTYLTSQVTNMKTKMDSYLDNMQQCGKNELKKLKEQINGQSVFSKVESDYPEDSELTKANSNNFVMQKTLKYCESIKVEIPATVLNRFNDAAQSLYDVISAYNDGIKDKPAYNNLNSFTSRRYVESADVRSVLFSDLIDVLDSLVDLLFNGLKNATRLALDSVSEMINSINGFITAEIRIPLISKLYKKKTGNVLCMRDISSLLVAITGTITYKFLFNSAPIGSDAELTQFKNYVDTHLSGSTSNTTDPSIIKIRRTLKIMATSFSLIAALVEAVNEAISSDTFERGQTSNGESNEDMGSMSLIIYTCELCSTAFSIPAFYDESEGWDWGFYVFDLIVLCLDYSISKYESRYVTKTMIGVIETVLFGVLRLLLLAMAYGTGGYRNTIDIIAIIVNSVSDILKFLTQIKSPKIKLLLALINIICAGASFTLGIFDAIAEGQISENTEL